MSAWIPLSSSTHAQAHYQPRRGFVFAQHSLVVPVLFAELTQLLPHYVLGFIQEGASYQLVALTGLNQHNLYVDDQGRWLAEYVPIALRGYPFQLVQQGEDSAVLCVAQAHLSPAGGGEPLFDGAGHLAEKVAQTRDFLLERERNRLLTQACVNRLQQVGVIDSWNLMLEQGEGLPVTRIQGFYTINEKALNALDTETYASLKGAPMAVAYGQLYSMGQTQQLRLRAQYHAKQNTMAAATAVDELLGLDTVQDDTLKFDF